MDCPVLILGTLRAMRGNTLAHGPLSRIRRASAGGAIITAGQLGGGSLRRSAMMRAALRRHLPAFASGAACWNTRLVHLLGLQTGLLGP